LDILNKNTIVKNIDSRYSSEVEPTKLDQECMSRIMGQYNSPKNHYTLIKNGLYYVESSNRKGAYFDTIGMLTPFASNYDLDIRLSQKPKNNMFPIAISNRYGLLDLKLRKFKIAPKYDDFKVIEDGEYFVVSIDNHYTVINENDETIIDLGYLHAQPKYSHNYLIMKNMFAKYGVLNLKNKQVKVNFEYDEVKAFKENIAFVHHNNRYKLISNDNKSVNDISLEKVENLHFENLVLAQTGNTCILINTKEMELIPLKTSPINFHTLVDVLNIFLKSDNKDLHKQKTNIEKLDSYQIIESHYNGKAHYFISYDKNVYKLVEFGENYLLKEVNEYEYCEFNKKTLRFIIKKNGNFGVVKGDGIIKVNPIFDKIYLTKYIYGNVLGAIKNNLFVITENLSDTTNLKIKDFSIVYEHSLKETFYTTKGEIYLIKGKDALGKTMLYDTDGKAILDTSYDEITHLGNSYFVIKDKDNVGLLNTKSKPKVEMQIEYKNIFYADGKFYGVDQDKILKVFTPYNF